MLSHAFSAVLAVQNSNKQGTQNVPDLKLIKKRDYAAGEAPITSGATYRTHDTQKSLDIRRAASPSSIPAKLLEHPGEAIRYRVEARDP